MKIRDLKALARETLVKWYGSVIVARLFRSVLVWLALAVSFVFLLFGLLNVGLFESWLWIFFPDFVPSTFAAIIFIMLFLGTLAFTVILDIWLTFGYEKMLLNICRGRGKGSGEILSAFSKDARPWKVLWVGFVRLVLIAAAALVPLFINACAIACGYNGQTAAPLDIWRIVIRTTQILAVMWMVYLSLGFTFATTLVIDKPETRVVEALQISLKEITCNRKPKLFWLMTFSFFFWLLLAAAVPFASLFVGPYIEVTLIIYYLDGLEEISELPAYAELEKKRLEAEAEEKQAVTEENDAVTEESGKAEPAAASEEGMDSDPENKGGASAEGVAAAAAASSSAAVSADAATTTGAEAPAETIPAETSPVEDGKPTDMAAIPRRIQFPDIEADPAAEQSAPGQEITDTSASPERVTEAELRTEESTQPAAEPQQTAESAQPAAEPQQTAESAQPAAEPQQAETHASSAAEPQQAGVKEENKPAQPGTEE